MGRNGETCIALAVVAVVDVALRVEHVPVAFAPRGVGHLEHDRVECPTVGGPAVVDGERVEQPAEGAELREEMDRPRRPAAEPCLHEVAHGGAERAVGAVEEVARAETYGRRAARRPERQAVERTRERVDVEIREEQFRCEFTQRGSEPAVSHRSLVDRSGRLVTRNVGPCRRGHAVWRRREKRGHRRDSSSRTTSTALCTPSSWNP